MLELTAAILALGVGPLLDRFSHSRGPTRAALDAFTFVAMLGLILGHIIPDAYALAGAGSLVVAALAWFGPTFLEHRVRSLASRAHLAAMLLGAIGLTAHGILDGMALYDPSGAEMQALPSRSSCIGFRPASPSGGWSPRAGATAGPWSPSSASRR